jgi:hypothetical protein
MSSIVDGRIRTGALTLIDQAASSLTNLMGNVAVATTGTVNEYGAFGTGVAIALLMNDLATGAVIEPLLVQHRDDPKRGAKACWYPLYLATPLVVVPFLFDLPTTLSIVLASLPALCGALTVRYFLLGLGNRAGALAVDLAWLLVTGCALAALSALGALTPDTSAIAWCGGGVVGCIIGVVCCRAGLKPAAGLLSYFRSDWRLAAPWAIEHVVARGTAQGLTFIILAAYGLAGTAAYRGCLTLLGPITVLLGALRFALLPEFLAKGTRHLLRRSVAFSVTCAAIVLLVGVALLLIPDRVGTALLGSTWGAASALLPFALAHRVAVAATGGPSLGLRIARVGFDSLFLRVASTLVVLSGSALAVGFGASLEGTLGLAAGLTALVLPFWFRRIRHATT